MAPVTPSRVLFLPSPPPSLPSRISSIHFSIHFFNNHVFFLHHGNPLLNSLLEHYGCLFERWRHVDPCHHSPPFRCIHKFQNLPGCGFVSPSQLRLGYHRYPAYRIWIWLASARQEENGVCRHRDSLLLACRGGRLEEAIVPLGVVWVISVPWSWRSGWWWLAEGASTIHGNAFK